MENEGKISQSLLLDEDSQSISSASTAKDSTGLPGLPDCFSDSESSPSPLGASADSVMGSTPVGELIQIPESDLELNESESQGDFIANPVMEDPSNQVSKEIDTVEQMCLDMQQTHEDQENEKKRRQFQASIWQHLGKYVLISYKDETYTSVGKLEKIEQDKDSDMKITLKTYRAKHEKAYTIGDAEIEAIETFDEEDPDVVESLIKGEGTDVRITTTDAETIIGLITDIDKDEHNKLVHLLIMDMETDRLTTRVERMKDIFKVEPTKEPENKMNLKRRLNQPTIIRFIIENTEREERGIPAGFHTILGENHVMLKTEHAGGVLVIIPLHNIEQILTDPEDSESEEETLKAEESTDHNTESSGSDTDKQNSHTELEQPSRDTPNGGKRTSNKWKDPKRPKWDQQEQTETYAERARKATRPKEVTFQWTKMPLTNKTVRRRDLKQDWIAAFKKAIQEEQHKAQKSSEWGDYSEQYIKALVDVGIRVPLGVMKFTRVNIDEDTINKPDDLNELWELAQQKAKPKEEVLEQRRWENLLKSEFDHEIDTAVRQNVEPDYRYAMTRAFVKMGHEVEPRWFSTLQITQDLTKSYRMREEVWDIAKKNLAYEQHIKNENRQMKPAWLLLLKEAIEYEKTRAIRFDTNIDYRAAVLISLSRTGRLITPERLAGLEIYTDKDMENEQTLDDIWERANLELDYQMITAKKGTRGPQKMDKKTLWSKKIMEHLYNLLTSTHTGNWTVDHGLIAERAFQDIGWNLNKCQFRHKFTVKNMVDRFLMLNRVNQNHIWHLACEIINDQKGDNSGDLPPQLLRQTWETTLGHKVHEHRIRRQYKVNKEHEEHHLTPVVNAFEAIGWNVPQSALTWLCINDAQDVLEDHTKRLLWYSGCNHQKKPREFFITSSIGMKPPKIEMDNGVLQYTELPFTLDDKVDKLQINHDYQQTMEKHQLSFDDWMERSNLNRLINMGDEPYEIDDPWILKTLTEIGHREFFVANWMMDYMSTKLNFDMWYNFIGKDLKIPQDLKSQLEEDKEEDRKSKWDLEHEWKVAGTPELLDRFQIKTESKETQTEDQKLTICSLQAPYRPMTAIKEEHGEEKPSMNQSHFTNEPLFIALSGEQLDKQQRKTLYEAMEQEMANTIREEAAEKAKAEITNKEYESTIITMGIRLPPMNRNVWRLETMLANNILHMQVLMTDIYPEHFAPNGVLAHVHIPTYVYIPNAVFKEYGITIEENTTSYVTFWQRLQEAQWQSTELIEPEHLRSTYKTSYRKLLRNQAPKTVATGKREITQHHSAQMEARRIGWHKLSDEDIYDWFIRPVERYFAIDMPLGSLLLRAMSYPQSADKLVSVIKRYTGIPKQALTNVEAVITELSKIRLSYEQDFIRKEGKETPIARMPPVQLTKSGEGCTYMHNDEVLHTKQYEKDTQEDDSDFTTGEESERLGTWNSIMSQHTKQIVEQLRKEPTNPQGLRHILRRAQLETMKFLTKCKVECKKANCMKPQTEQCKEVHTHETGKRKAENTSPDQSTSSTNTPIEGEETNLVNRFNRQMHIVENCGKLTVEELIQNPQLARTDEERAKIREIKYYAEAAERAQYDTIKADPKDEEFLQVLEGVKKNCFNAYASAQKDLQRLLKRRKTGNDKENVLGARRKTAKPPGVKTAKRTHVRPTAWPTVKQIREGNPYKQKVQASPTTPHQRFTGEPERTPPFTTRGRNPGYNANFTTDYLQASPENHKKFQRYDPNLSQVNTPSSESFNSEVTSTSTPAVQRRYFGKTEPMPIPSPTRRPEHQMHPGAIPKQTVTRTRRQDPSPPHPGGNTKTIRDMAPNRQPLFHYRFYDPKSKTPPDFTKLQLSAAQVKEYLRGLTDTRDCSNEGYAKVIAYGIENYHAITIHSLEEETFRVITIEDRKTPRDRTKTITEECVYIPEYAMEDFDNLLQAVHLEVMQPMQYDQGYKGNLLLLRAATADWKAKATIHTTETIRGTERTVTIVVRYKNEARFIQIPWLTFSKLVEAYQKVREDYQKLRKRIQQEKANQRQ
jgi:hypothetical protein